jgi:hypothetical protein
MFCPLVESPLIDGHDLREEEHTTLPPGASVLPIGHTHVTTSNPAATPLPDWFVHEQCQVRTLGIRKKKNVPGGQQGVPSQDHMQSWHKQ